MSSPPETVRLPSSLRLQPVPAPLDRSQSSLSTETVTVDQLHSFPCRVCLNDGLIGERMLLVSYDPFLGNSPYRGAGPIFVHADPECKPYDQKSAGGMLPDQQRRRLLSVRAYNDRHMMVDAEVVQGDGLVELSERFLADPVVDYLHVHNARPGCFAVRIERALPS